ELAVGVAVDADAVAVAVEQRALALVLGGQRRGLLALGVEEAQHATFVLVGVAHHDRRRGDDGETVLDPRAGGERGPEEALQRVGREPGEVPGDLGLPGRRARWDGALHAGEHRLGARPPRPAEPTSAPRPAEPPRRVALGVRAAEAHTSALQRL